MRREFGILALVLIALLVVITLILLANPTEPENVDIETFIEERSVNVNPGDSVITTVYISNQGNTDVEIRLGFNNHYRWNLSLDDRLSPYLDRQSERKVTIRDGPLDNDTIGIEFTHTVPTDERVGHRWQFFVDVTIAHGGLSKQIATHAFLITVGFIDQQGIPDKYQMVRGYVSQLRYNLTNLVVDPLDRPATFHLDYDMPEGIDYTVTAGEVTNLTAEEIEGTEPLEEVVFKNGEVVNLTIWWFCPQGFPLSQEWPADVTASFPSPSEIVFSKSLDIDIVDPVHNLTFEPFSNVVHVDRDTRWAVFFDIDSHSNVQEYLSIEYLYDNENVSLDNTVEEETIGPYDGTDLRIIVEVTGVGVEETELTVVITYGPALEYTSRCSVTLLVR